MAIINYESEEHRPNVSWGAIFGGSIITLALQFAFMSLGSGIGFSAFDPAQGDSLNAGSLVTLGIFTVISSLISLFIGGYVAGRLAGFQIRSVSALHGLCSWAVVSVFTVLMLGSGLGSIVRTTAGVVKGAAGSANVDADSLVNEAKQILKETGKPELNPDRLAREAKTLPKDAARGGESPSDKLDQAAGALDREAIANVISKRLNVSQEEANQLLGQAEQKTGDVKASVKDAAQAGTDVAAKISWGTFASLLLGAIAAILGGLVGGPKRVAAEAYATQSPRKAA